jgi:hypothetical protein
MDKERYPPHLVQKGNPGSIGMHRKSDYRSLIPGDSSHHGHFTTRKPMSRL